MKMIRCASIIALMASTSALSAQHVIMRRPVPNGSFRNDTPSVTPDPKPDVPSTDNGLVAYGWQPSCTSSSSTAVCVRLISGKDFIVPNSECPSSQSPQAEALAHERGLFGMNDGVNAANASKICTTKDLRSYFLGYGNCVKNIGSSTANVSMYCIQAYVNEAGEVTARQLVDAGKCASQPQDAAYTAFVSGPGKNLVPGSIPVAPSSFYSSWGQSCTVNENEKTEIVVAGNCLPEGGYVCNQFNVSKDIQGKYSISKKMGALPSQCMYMGAPIDASEFVESLGYDVLKYYSASFESFCEKYDTYGATSSCSTTIVSKPGGGYDVNFGRKIDCRGFSTGSPTPVPVSRCESAPPLTSEQRDLITRWGYSSYEEANAKDCTAAVNFNYNLQAKVLPGAWSVKRSEKTYEYPTAAMRKKTTPTIGEQYGEYTDMVYEGSFDINFVCTDISPSDVKIDTMGETYWSGPYTSEFYKSNHSFAIDKKLACLGAKERFMESRPGSAAFESIVSSVGERWGSQPSCYKPSYGIEDIEQLTPTGTESARFTINKCSPLRSRFFTWNGKAWVPGAYSDGNPPL